MASLSISLCLNYLEVSESSCRLTFMVQSRKMISTRGSKMMKQRRRILELYYHGMGFISSRRTLFSCRQRHDRANTTHIVAGLVLVLAWVYVISAQPYITGDTVS